MNPVYRGVAVNQLGEQSQEMEDRNPRIEELKDELKKYRTALRKVQREYDGLDLYRDQLEKDHDRLRNNEQASLEKIKTLKAQVNDTLEALDATNQALDTAKHDREMAWDARDEAQDKLRDVLEKGKRREETLEMCLKALHAVNDELSHERIAHDDLKDAYKTIEKELADVRFDHATDHAALRDGYVALGTNHDTPLTLEQDLILVNTHLHDEIEVLKNERAEERLAHSRIVADLLKRLEDSQKGKDEHDTNEDLAQSTSMSRELRHMHLNR